MSSKVTAAHRHQYETDGYFVLESVISNAHLALLRECCRASMEEMNTQMDREGTDTLGINHRGKRYFIGQSYRTHPELADFLYGELTAEVCRATLGDTAYLHNDQFVVKCEQTRMNFAWHQDGAYVQARIGDHAECITCWCPLDDVNEENGTVYLLPASRFGKRELVEHHRDPETNDRVGYFGDDPGDPVIVPAGSMAVFSSLVFHRSGTNPSGSQRRVYLAQFAPEPLHNRPGDWPQYFAEPFLQNGRRVQADILGP
jgi:ectoine hydroxylase-related dioxygenase (phytanoyl-CoA dioxygenase family)